MSKSFNWNNPRDNRDVEIQRFCAVFFALALATVIMACTVSFRYQEEDGDTMPPETTTTAAASTWPPASLTFTATAVAAAASASRSWKNT